MSDDIDGLRAEIAECEREIDTVRREAQQHGSQVRRIGDRSDQDADNLLRYVKEYERKLEGLYRRLRQLGG